MDIQTTLRKLGLTENQVKIYLNMLGEGQIKVKKILDLSDVGSGKIYENMRDLLDKGLVSKIVKDGVQHYRASPPAKIKQLVEEKEEEIEQIRDEVHNAIPELQELYSETTEETQVELYTGDEGFLTVLDRLEDAMDEANAIYAIGASGDRRTFINNRWLEHHREAKSHDCAYYILFTEADDETRNFISQETYDGYKPRKLSLVEMAPITVVNDSVLIIDYEARQQIFIKSGSVAEMMRSMIEDFWDMAEEF